jgi:hypothetical protein
MSRRKPLHRCWRWPQSKQEEEQKEERASNEEKKWVDWTRVRKKKKKVSERWTVGSETLWGPDGIGGKTEQMAVQAARDIRTVDRQGDPTGTKGPGSGVELGRGGVCGRVTAGGEGTMWLSPSPLVAQPRPRGAIARKVAGDIQDPQETQGAAGRRRVRRVVMRCGALQENREQSNGGGGRRSC